MQNKITPKEEFKAILKGGNFVTPHAIEFIKDGDYISEVATGEFMGDKIYGVTVLNTVTKSIDHNLSKCEFLNLDDAVAYANSLSEASREN